MTRMAMDATQTLSLTLSEVRGIYKTRMVEDFPPAELKPLSAIESMLSQGRYACYGFCAGEGILAYAFFVKLGRWALLDYYAVRRDSRDQGLGSRFLGELISGPLQSFDCALAEVDDPDFAAEPQELAIRNRRKAFYLRNGLWETGVRASTFGVPFQLLALPVGERMDGESIRRVYAALYHSVLPDWLYDKQIRI